MAYILQAILCNTNWLEKDICKMEKILPRIVQNQRYTQTSYYGTYSPPKTHLSNSRSILLHLDCLRTSFMVRQEDLHLDSDLLKSSKVYTTTKGPEGHNIKL